MHTLRLNKFGIILIIVLLLSVATATFFYVKIRKLEKGNQLSVGEAKDLVDEVSRLIVLPEDEDPTIATVSDPEKVKDQPFFAKAKTGDKVLIYLKARKAILYDPVAKKLIEVAPLSDQDSSLNRDSQ